MYFNFIINLMYAPDVDECGENLHGCTPDTEICRNTVGAYECDMTCDSGYQYSLALRTCVGNVSQMKYVKPSAFLIYCNVCSFLFGLNDTNRICMTTVFD